MPYATTPIINRKFLTVGLFFSLCILYFSLFLETYWRLIQDWVSFSATTSLLILCISIYIIWQKRDILKTLVVKPNFILGTGLILFGCLIFVSGRVSGTIAGENIASVIVLLGLISMILGNRFLTALYVPVGYLALMFTLFEELLGNIAIYLQYTTAWIAAILLKGSGFPVYLSRVYIELPHINLEVAKACAGINHIFALVAFSVPLSYFTQKTTTRKVLLVLGAFFFGIFANGLRVALIGIYTYHFPGNNIHGPFYIFYVSFIFVTGLALIVLLGFITKIVRKKNAGSENNEQNSAPIRKLDLHALPVAALSIAVLMLGATSVYTHLYISHPVGLKASLESFPAAFGPYRMESAADTDWPLDRLNPDQRLARKYTDRKGNKIGLYIAYFASQDQERELINYYVDHIHKDKQTIPLHIGSDTVQVNKIDRLNKTDPRSAYFWYDINGDIYLSRYGVKFATAINGLTKRRTNGAMVLITHDDDPSDKGNVDNTVIRFIQTIFPLIDTYLKTA